LSAGLAARCRRVSKGDELRAALHGRVLGQADGRRKVGVVPAHAAGRKRSPRGKGVGRHPGRKRRRVRVFSRRPAREGSRRPWRGPDGADYEGDARTVSAVADMDSDLQSPLVESFRRGEVSRDDRLTAAMGALPARADEVLALLVMLCDDPDAEIAATATATLDTLPVDAVRGFLAGPNVPADIRVF